MLAGTDERRTAWHVRTYRVRQKSRVRRAAVKRIGLVARKRLRQIPKDYRALHEFCFFLHDECVRALLEYETARAHIETIKFSTSRKGKEFETLVKTMDVIGALRALGYRDATRRVVLNTIRMAMISDCLHHIYEAFRCFEKRKFIVGFNLLRKPLTENLLYLCWMYGREDEFYCRFTAGDPKALTTKELGPKRVSIYADAIARLEHHYLFNAETLENLLYKRSSGDGLQMYFQHAVHLVTTLNQETRTAAENFNFIFRDPLDDDIYDVIYKHSPMVLLFLSHVIVGVFDEMKKMDETSRHLFELRTVLGYGLIVGPERDGTLAAFEAMLEERPKCGMCAREESLTKREASRMLLMAEFRCGHCGTWNPYLQFSYPEYQA